MVMVKLVIDKLELGVYKFLEGKEEGLEEAVWELVASGRLAVVIFEMVETWVDNELLVEVLKLMVDKLVEAKGEA